MLDHEMRFAVTLIFANKADLPHALTPEEVKVEVPSSVANRPDLVLDSALCRVQLKLDQFTDKIFHVQPTCATTGDGLWEGMKWLSENVKPI